MGSQIVLSKTAVFVYLVLTAAVISLFANKKLRFYIVELLLNKYQATYTFTVFKLKYKVWVTTNGFMT